MHKLFSFFPLVCSCFVGWYIRQRLKMLIVLGILLEGGRERVNILMLIKVLIQSMKTDNTFSGIVLQVQRFLTQNWKIWIPMPPQPPAWMKWLRSGHLIFLGFSFHLYKVDTELEILIYFFCVSILSYFSFTFSSLPFFFWRHQWQNEILLHIYVFFSWITLMCWFIACKKAKNVRKM